MNSISPESSNPVLSALNNQTTKRRRKWRMFKDKLAKYSMTVGGLSIIMAICLIFFYLLYVILPLFSSASIKEIHSFSLASPSMGETLYLAAEEKNEIAVRFTKLGHVVFYKLKTGTIISDTVLPFPENVAITSFGVADKATNVVAFGFSNGQALVVKPVYDISYPNDVRVITPRISYPLGKEAIIVDETEQALVNLDVQLGEEDNTLVAVTDDFRLLVVQATKEESFLDDEDDEDTEINEINLEYVRGELSLAAEHKVTHLLLDKEQRIVYIADNDGQISRFDISDKSQPQLLQRIHVVNYDTKITSITFLTGDISLLIGDSNGQITQWFPVRDQNNNSILTKIREFHEQSAAIIGIASEERRKGFVAIDSSGQLGIYHSTAHRTLKIASIGSNNTLKQIAITPRADTLLVEDNQANLHIWAVHNEHPEVSMSALWGKVWYESYEKPDYVWQSSSASSDFEPKFSLTPLAFGTFKAAFYAMLIAIPLSILGAIYTAYFMAPKMRSIVKPSIEIMAALPTVILGFLAGLWLAPVLEKDLLGFFIALLLLPLSVFIFAYISRFWLKLRLADGWQAALLIPIIILVTWFSFAISQPLELFLFNGNLPHWLTAELGIGFDQRNALVVGIAMGIAVIPTIFSMTEDAIFGVPKHLTVGSLALGATPWQTMIKVVLLTASPGIFSAVMIGMGRAIGETMIVLMATGNTPIMDFNIFEGLRTLSANLAVEMPETEVASTHYRVLFLAGFVLFVFTFVINTVAEVVRHRLRKKYSSL
jgi:phosphate transport system permease protein